MWLSVGLRSYSLAKSPSNSPFKRGILLAGFIALLTPKNEPCSTHCYDDDFCSVTLDRARLNMAEAYFGNLDQLNCRLFAGLYKHETLNPSRFTLSSVHTVLLHEDTITDISSVGSTLPPCGHSPVKTDRLLKSKCLEVTSVVTFALCNHISPVCIQFRQYAPSLVSFALYFSVKPTKHPVPDAKVSVNHSFHSRSSLDSTLWNCCISRMVA